MNDVARQIYSSTPSQILYGRFRVTRHCRPLCPSLVNRSTLRSVHLGSMLCIFTNLDHEMLNVYLGRSIDIFLTVSDLTG